MCIELEATQVVYLSHDAVIEVSYREKPNGAKPQKVR